LSLIIAHEEAKKKTNLCIKVRIKGLSLFRGAKRFHEIYLLDGRRTPGPLTVSRISVPLAEISKQNKRPLEESTETKARHPLPRRNRLSRSSVRVASDIPKEQEPEEQQASSAAAAEVVTVRRRSVVVKNRGAGTMRRRKEPGTEKARTMRGGLVKGSRSSRAKEIADEVSASIQEPIEIESERLCWAAGLINQVAGSNCA
jgi:hypothetical protein